VSLPQHQFLLATLVFVTGVLANRGRPAIFTTAIGLAAISIPLGWSRLLSAGDHLMLARWAMEIVFFSFTAAMILVAVLKDHMATRGSITGAICVYLLMGLSWACGYSALEIVDGESFQFVKPGGHAADEAGPSGPRWSTTAS
jgi:hypothetical protein